MQNVWYIHTERDRDWDRGRERTQDRWVLIYDAEMFPMVWDRDRDQDLLFPILPVPFPVPLQSRSCE